MDKVNINKALEDVNLAFKQLEFAIKLMCHCELRHLNNSKFDADITILSDKGSNISYAAPFSSYEEIIKHSQINVSISFGASAIALYAALKTVGVNFNKGVLDDIGIIVYMVRCAFAHNIADPKWKVKTRFLKQVSLILDGEKISINFEQLNGHQFKYDDIGGLLNWYRIKNAAVSTIKKLCNTHISL